MFHIDFPSTQKQIMNSIYNGPFYSTILKYLSDNFKAILKIIVVAEGTSCPSLAPLDKGGCPFAPPPIPKCLRKLNAHVGMYTAVMKAISEKFGKIVIVWPKSKRRRSGGGFCKHEKVFKSNRRNT